MKMVFALPILMLAATANAYVTDAPSEIRARLYNENKISRSFDVFQHKPSQDQLSAAIPTTARTTITSTWNCSIKANGSLSECRLESSYPQGTDLTKTRRLLRLVVVTSDIVREARAGHSKLSLNIFQNDPKRHLESVCVPGRCGITPAPPPAPSK